MKNKIRYKLAIICLMFSCTGCDVLTDHDSYPVSAQIDGVFYESVPEYYLAPHIMPFTLDCQDTFFDFSLVRRLSNDDVGKFLVLTSRIRSDLEINKRYDITTDESYITTSDSRGFSIYPYWQNAVSGWIMFTDILPSTSTSIHVMGEFEVIFEEPGDQKETLLTDGYFGPGTCFLLYDK